MNLIHVDFKAKKRKGQSCPIRAQKFDKIRTKCRELYHVLADIEKNEAFRDHTNRCVNAIIDGYLQIFQK